MLAAEIASTTAKPSMILARNRRVGSLKDEPPRFKNRTSHPGFVLKNRYREARPPNPVRKVKAEWIRARKSGKDWQGCRHPPLEGRAIACGQVARRERRRSIRRA